jgi:hypothetical protein
MGAVSTVPAFLEALRDALTSQTSLSGVNVYTAPVDDLSMGEKSIVLCVEPVQADYEYLTMPRTQVTESYEVLGVIWSWAAGGGEDAIETAREDAYAVLEGVHDYVAGLVGKAETQGALGVDHVKVIGHRLEQGAGDAARLCKLTFTLAADAYFSPA